MNNLNHQSLSLPRKSWEHLTLPHLPLGFVLESRSPLRNPGHPNPSGHHRGLIGWLDTVDSVGSQTCLVVIGTSVPKKMDAKMCHVTMWCHGMSLLSKPGTSGAGWCPWDSLCTKSLRVQFSLNQPSKERNSGEYLLTWWGLMSNGHCRISSMTEKSYAWLIHHHSSNSSVWNEQTNVDHEHQIVAKSLRHSLVHLPNSQYYLHEIASTSIDGYRKMVQTSIGVNISNTLDAIQVLFCKV